MVDDIQVDDIQAARDNAASPEDASRVVVRFHADVGVPYAADGWERLDKANLGFWGRLTAAFPGITLRPLFQSVSPNRLRDLVAEAVQRDGSYAPPNFSPSLSSTAPRR
jgi:hypothetical protein